MERENIDKDKKSFSDLFEISDEITKSEEF
jgi:hypothetical protein